MQMVQGYVITEFAVHVRRRNVAGMIDICVQRLVDIDHVVLTEEPYEEVEVVRRAKGFVETADLQTDRLGNRGGEPDEIGPAICPVCIRRANEILVWCDLILGLQAMDDVRLVAESRIGDAVDMADDPVIATH